MTAAGMPVGRGADGRVALRLGATERRILGSLVGELRAALGDPAAAAPGGTLARLYPPAFPDDPEAERAWRDLVHDDLVAGRLARLAVVERTLDADALSEDEAVAWLAVLNDLRLVLGAALDIREDDTGELPAPDDPEATRRAIFGWLGWVVASFVDVLADGLPEDPDPSGT